MEAYFMPYDTQYLGDDIYLVGGFLVFLFSWQVRCHCPNCHDRDRLEPQALRLRLFFSILSRIASFH